MRRLVSLRSIKQHSWVADRRAFQPRWPCSGRGCRWPWAELGWARLAVSWISTLRSPDSKKTRVRVSLRSVEQCGSNGQGKLYLPPNFAFAGVVLWESLHLVRNACIHCKWAENVTKLMTNDWLYLCILRCTCRIWFQGPAATSGFIGLRKILVAGPHHSHQVCLHTMIDWETELRFHIPPKAK